MWITKGVISLKNEATFYIHESVFLRSFAGILDVDAETWELIR